MPRGVVIIDEITNELIVEASGDPTGCQSARMMGAHIERLMDAAPSDASMLFQLRREPQGYLGVLKIYSATREFSAKAMDPNCEQVISAVFSSAEEQLMDWKRSRSLDFEVSS
jgi:hypothetical protein